jgi:hypothetical protein
MILPCLPLLLLVVVAAVAAAAAEEGAPLVRRDHILAVVEDMTAMER